MSEIVINGTAKFWEFRDYMDQRELNLATDYEYWYGLGHNIYKVKLVSKESLDIESFLRLKFGQ